MSLSLKYMPALTLALHWQWVGAAGATRPAAADPDLNRQAFVTAMQRIRLNLPEPPDSPALQAYAIHDYLVAARLRRDLSKQPADAMDAAIDAFLQAHVGQPVAHDLRHDWLVNLAQRRRWDRFLARSADVTDPQLVCDRLEGRLLTGDTEGLPAAALARWSLPQKQPSECNDVFGWLRQQNLITPTLAETKVRAALAADNPRLAREFAPDVPVSRVAPLLQWSDLLEAPRAALTVFATHPALSVEPEALVAGFEKLAHTDSGAALELLPALLGREDLTPAARTRLQAGAAPPRPAPRTTATPAPRPPSTRCRRMPPIPKSRNGRSVPHCGPAITAGRSPGSTACRQALRRSRAGAIGAHAPRRRRPVPTRRRRCTTRLPGCATIMAISRRIACTAAIS